MRRPALAFLVLVAVAAFAFAAEERVLDDFDRLSGWKASASDDAAVTVSPDEGAMRIDFAFPPVGGYVTVHKEFAVELPENWAFTFRLRGEAPDNHLEFKLIDPGAKNVWRRTYRDLHFPRDWEEMTVQKARVDLAWGKASGGKPTRVAALEIAISTGSGGRGSVWIDDLRFEERAPASQYYRTLEVKASSALPGHDPANVLDGDPTTGWKSGGGRREQWVQIDLLRDQEYGGLIIDWDPEDYATSYQLQTSEDGEEWAIAYLSTWGNGGRDYVYMPDAHSRYLRLLMQSSSRGEGYGINGIQIEPFEFSRTPNDFFQAIAQDAPPGTFPKYFYGVQPYWTVVGAAGDDKEALLSDDGVLEIEKESFTIEPFLFADAKLLGSSAVETRPSLEGGRLPIPSVNWRNEKVGLTVTAFAAGEAGASTLYARYRVESRSEVAQRVTLYLAVRPFQVVPPWQSLNMAGGVSPISELSS
ncbi:MAG: hypothetical protein QOD06_2154, partial [Candidatus Binatota bacterium]|nr:hypothetical protein [Candidatus Binatota bacterium]